MNAAQEFISDLAEKIPLPTIYWQIRLLMNNPNAKIGDYERLIQGDPQLTTHTILIANSEFFGFGRKVDGLYDAISLIGVGQLHDLLLGSLPISLDKQWATLMFFGGKRSSGALQREQSPNFAVCHQATNFSR